MTPATQGVLDVRTGRTRSVKSVTYDAPAAVLELLYGRAVLGSVDVLPAMPPVIDAPEPLPAAAGAAERWKFAYETVLDRFSSTSSAAGPGWLASVDGRAVDHEAARQWIAQRRSALIEGALFSNGSNAPRLMRRSQSLEHTTVDMVLVLPLVGAYSEHVRDRVQSVSLSTFLDESSWLAAVVALPAVE